MMAGNLKPKAMKRSEVQCPHADFVVTSVNVSLQANSFPPS
jgi:hypothetical protein